MHHITCHHLSLSLVSDSLHLLSLGTRWSAKERSTRCSDAPWMIRWAATSWPSRHWQPTHATTIKGSRNLRSWSQFWTTSGLRVYTRLASGAASLQVRRWFYYYSTTTLLLLTTLLLPTTSWVQTSALATTSVSSASSAATFFVSNCSSSLSLTTERLHTLQTHSPTRFYNLPVKDIRK